MEKKTIGAFIATLRKANGMTQQDLADRLHISNKTVSHWERDESAPDISIIPALAELLGVSCDELLKGERIPLTAQAEKGDAKIEKRVRFLIQRTVSRLRFFVWIGMALSLTGFIGTFLLSYGFFRPIIGFCVLLLFEVAACFAIGFAGVKMQDLQTNSELWEEAEGEWKEKCRKSLPKVICPAVFTLLSTLLFSLPLLYKTDGYSVVTWGNYVKYGFLPLAVLWTVVLCFLYKPCLRLLNGEGLPKIKLVRKRKPTKAEVYGLLQLALLAVATALFLLAKATVTDENYRTGLRFILMTRTAQVLTLADFFLFVFALWKEKAERRTYLLPGLRNVLLAVPTWYTDGVLYVWFDDEITLRFDADLAICTVLHIAALFIFCRIGERVWEKIGKRKNGKGSPVPAPAEKQSDTPADAPIEGENESI